MIREFERDNPGFRATHIRGTLAARNAIQEEIHESAIDLMVVCGLRWVTVEMEHDFVQVYSEGPGVPPANSIP